VERINRKGCGSRNQTKAVNHARATRDGPRITSMIMLLMMLMSLQRRVGCNVQLCQGKLSGAAQVVRERRIETNLTEFKRRSE
jgi:hypothetical protein